MRQLWIIRINAAARENGLTYGQFIAGLKRANVEIDRKILADLAIRDSGTFTRIAELAKMSKALDRLKKNANAEVEGSPEGVADGEVSKLAQAVAGNQFVTEVYRCIKENYAVEGLDPSRVRGRVALKMAAAAR
jgi:hypothetical protein